MSMLQTRPTEQITPPSSFVDPPLTPPATDKKSFTQAPRVIALFSAIQAGRHTEQDSWAEFRLVEGEYDEIERLLGQDEALSGFVKDKIRYDHDRGNHQLVIRMPTGVHERFIDGVEDAIRSQLKAIRRGSDKAAHFAQKVWPARSTEISFPVENAPSNARSKYEPDASFWHDDALYPGVIVEVAYSQKRKRLERLAENYLLDSDASVQVVVGLDIEYGRKESREAVLSVWRTQLDGHELRVVNEVADQPFRDKQGNPTNRPGLQLSLHDFACEELARDIIDAEGYEITLSTQDLCRYLAAAEDKTERQEALVKHAIPSKVIKRKRSETPPEEITSSDEARYLKEEERAMERVAENDSDYDGNSAGSSHD